MKSSNFNETSLNIQSKDEKAKKFINALEKATGTKALNTETDYNSLSDFTFRIKNYSELSNNDIENSVNNIYLTEEQLEIFIQEMKSLVNEI